MTITRPSVELPTFLRRPPPTVQHPIAVDNDTRTKRFELLAKAPAIVDSSTQRMEVISEPVASSFSTQPLEPAYDALAIDGGTQPIDMPFDVAAIDSAT